MNSNITDLFEGRAESPNETIAYFVEQARNIHVEHKAVMANLELGQRQMNAYEHRRIELEALQQKYIEDLEFWLRKEQDGANPKLEVIDGDGIESGSDQHGDEEPESPEGVASGVGPEVDGVPNE
jgi:hypothetical protein